MSDFIPLALPDINDKDIQRVVEVLRSGMLIQGKNCAQLENDLANYLGVKHTAVTSSGTAALHISLLALGIKPGDEVIVPAFSFIATANVVEIIGAKPVFVDIDPQTFNIDVKKIESVITSKTRAIMPVHEFGLSSDMNEILQIGRRNNLFVIEDAACALGAEEHKRKTGGYGDIAAFSFHPRKAITAGEGGLVATNNDKTADILYALRDHGRSILNGQTEFILAGFNYRMTDIQAALLIDQFNRFDEILARREYIARRYSEEIKNPHIRIPNVPMSKKHCWQTFHIMLGRNINREQVISEFKRNGIGTGPGAQCIPAQMFYKHKYNYNYQAKFPYAFEAGQEGLAIPIYHSMKETDITRVIEQVNQLNVS